MKHPIVLAFLAFSLTSCSSPSAPPLPTHTPFPTYTPYPTYTPLPAVPAPLPQPTPIPQPNPTSPPTKTAESQQVAIKCIAWTSASSHIGEATCVRGTVTSTYKDAKSNAFFIDFDKSRTSFYAVSFKYSWENLAGQCVEINGKIASYNGRPQIVVERRDQLEICR